LSIIFPKIKQNDGNAAPNTIEDAVPKKKRSKSPEFARAVHKYQKSICSVPLKSEF
jgi:hypothetical protein